MYLLLDKTNKPNARFNNQAENIIRLCFFKPETKITTWTLFLCKIITVDVFCLSKINSAIC